MSDSAESVSSTFTTIVVVAVVVPLAVTVIGLIAVFAYKRERERNFVPPSLANMPGMTSESCLSACVLKYTHRLLMSSKTSTFP